MKTLFWRKKHFPVSPLVGCAKLITGTSKTLGGTIHPFIPSAWQPVICWSLHWVAGEYSGYHCCRWGNSICPLASVLEISPQAERTSRLMHQSHHSKRIELSDKQKCRSSSDTSDCNKITFKTPNSPRMLWSSCGSLSQCIVGPHASPLP